MLTEWAGLADGIDVPPRTQSLECGARRKDIGVSIPTADNLHPDRKAIRTQNRRDGNVGVTSSRYPARTISIASNTVVRMIWSRYISIGLIARAMSPQW